MKDTARSAKSGVASTAKAAQSGAKGTATSAKKSARATTTTRQARSHHHRPDGEVGDEADGCDRQAQRIEDGRRRPLTPPFTDHTRDRPG